MVKGDDPKTMNVEGTLMEGVSCDSESVRLVVWVGDDGEIEGDEEETDGSSERCFVCGVDGEIHEMSDDGEEEAYVGGGDGEGEGLAEKVRVQRDVRGVKELADPRRPTEKEVREHEVTHFPYRNWCEVCVRAKGKDADHRAEVGRIGG